MLKQTNPSCQSCPSRAHNLLSCCSVTDIEQVSQEKISQYYRAGQTIFGEGSRAAGLYCVHEGRVKITKSGGDGKEQIIRLVKSGDLLVTVEVAVPQKLSKEATKALEAYAAAAPEDPRSSLTLEV